MSAKGLGRGLSALLGEQSVSGQDGVVKLPLSKIYPNDAQPRRAFDEDALAQLSQSISQHGLITPIAVRRLSTGGYQIVAGERRWRACRMAGLFEVPAVILDADDKQILELALVENLQREDLNPFEQAEGFKALIDNFGLTQDEVASRMGKSRSAVSNSMRLLALPDEIKQMVCEGKLSEGHARTLLAAQDREIMITLAQKVIDYALNVRQTEQLVKNSISDKPEPQAKAKPEVDYAAELSKALSSVLGRKVNIIHGKNKGKIELEYYGLDDLEQLKKLLEASVDSKC